MFGLASLRNTSVTQRRLARMGGINPHCTWPGTSRRCLRQVRRGVLNYGLVLSKRRCVPLPGRSLLVAVALDSVALVFLSPEHTSIFVEYGWDNDWGWELSWPLFVGVLVCLPSLRTRWMPAL